MPFGLWARTCPRNHELDGGPDPPPREWAILGKESSNVRYRDFLPWAVQKWLNRSICRLGCGLAWAEGGTSSIVFARWCQCAHIGGHIGAFWRIRLNRLSAASTRSYVKWLWLLVVVSPGDFRTWLDMVKLNQRAKGRYTLDNTLNKQGAAVADKPARLAASRRMCCK